MVRIEEKTGREEGGEEQWRGGQQTCNDMYMICFPGSTPLGQDIEQAEGEAGDQQKERRPDSVRRTYLSIRPETVEKLNTEISH